MSHPNQHEILPDLAAFVGATIRDKVVLDQMEEIRLLKHQLEATRRVEITGPGGAPVIASGSFSRGEFNDSASNENGSCGVLWSVGLETNMEDLPWEDDTPPTVPMNMLSNIEIRVGGVLYATSEEIEGTKVALGIRRGNVFDLNNSDGTKRQGGMSRSAVVQFGGSEEKTAFLTFHMKDFPAQDWRSLRSVAMVNRSIAIRNEEREELGLEEEEEHESESPMDIYRYITERLAHQHPNQRVEVSSVSFCVASVGDAIASLWRGKEFEILKDRYLEDPIAAADREVVSRSEALRNMIESARY
jgi:hypothetical protein